ncbi:hypothetical protein ACM26V_14425 [Salipaludibacillus sp. HK11]|uniref:hypothetical protein n=1 Tax=Salipaludibacillus sp. HK11 TaxID=3394320 RepID=UPI0039FBCECC
MSLLEWVVLLAFPLMLLGYQFRQYLNRIFWIALAMSAISTLLHFTPMHLTIIIAAQIAIFVLFIKAFLRRKLLEVFVIATMGYGFYVLIQVLLIEIIMNLSSFSYFDVIFSTNAITPILQGMTVIIGVSICSLLKWKNYHLSELRMHITASQISSKIKTMIISSAMLTFIFICISSFVMLADDMAFKQLMIILSIIVFMLILSFYHVLYIQFQMRSLIEAKKYYLDQDQQFSQMIENIKRESENHFQVISKLSENGSTEFIKSYIEKEKLDRGTVSIKSPQNNIYQYGQPLDELMFAFLVNKRKLARLFNIQMRFSSNIQETIPVTFKQIKSLNTVINDLITLHSQSHEVTEKRINFEVITNNQGIEFHIDSDLNLNKHQDINLNLLNSLNEIDNEMTLTLSQLEPFKVIYTSNQTGG